MQCVPHRAIWEFYLPSKCYSLPKVMLSSASIQVLTDVIMFLLPQKIIWGLHMTWQKKLGVSIIFGVGILASISACIRLVHIVSFASQPDSMFLIGPLLFWACAEMTCGFFIFSVPYLSKVIVESGLPRKVKGSLGFSAKSSTPSNPNSDFVPRSGPQHIPKVWRTSGTNYSVIEEGIPLQTGRSESQTHLRGEQPTIQVMHTTDITVTRDVRSE